VTGGAGVGFNGDVPVSPASVMKIQVALAVERAIASGSLDGAQARILSPTHRTAGPAGVSLMRDEVRMSVRDLVVAMLTISDNAATDELIDLVGLDEVNRVTQDLGLERTRIAAGLRETLEQIAGAAGFGSYAAMVGHDPDATGAPSNARIEAAVFASPALDPAHGTRTTAAETVHLLQAIWTGRAGPAQACAAVRHSMSRQLTRNRIASAFGPAVSVAAKSGGLLGVVRNEAGVVTFPDGAAFAVAVFSRRTRDARPAPALVDAAIGQVARTLIDQLRAD
jgi:beta-lactamase class A